MWKVGVKDKVETLLLERDEREVQKKNPMDKQISD